jgi:hypothetical protein
VAGTNLYVSVRPIFQPHPYRDAELAWSLWRHVQSMRASREDLADRLAGGEQA